MGEGALLLGPDLGCLRELVQGFASGISASFPDGV